MKNLLLTFMVSALSIFNVSQTEAVSNDESQFVVAESCEYLNPNYCGNNSLTNGLESNQTTLFYMYSDNVGHYFVDPLADEENVIYLGLDDYKVLSELEIDVDTLHHGKRFVGTFADNTLWELIGIEAVIFD